MKKLAALAACLVIACTGAMAATISFTHTTPTQATPFTDTFTLNNFDSTLGTLTGVAITLAYTTTGEVDVINTLGTNQPFTNATSSVPLTLSGPGGLSQSGNAVAGPLSGTAPPSPPPSSFPGASGGGALTINVPAASFALFTIPPAASTASYSVTAGAGSYAGTAAPGVFFSGTATAGGVTTVTYTYTVVGNQIPEPASMALFGGGLLALAVIGRKKFARD